VLRQRNRNEERAVADEEQEVGVGGVPFQDEPGPLQDEPGPLEFEPFTVAGDTTWGSPAPAVAPATVSAEPAKTRRPFSWGQVLILLAGAASLVFGVGAVLLGGLAGSVTAPVVQVFTFDHTPLLGLIETAAGAILVLCAFVPGGRWLAGPIGVGAIVGGALILAELDWIQRNLAAERRFGWVAIAIGTVAYFGAMVPTRKRVPVTP
jgi:hypothetical protein